jgi:hypothetical protein
MVAYHTECHHLCSLGPDTPFGPMATELLANGKSLRVTLAAIVEKGGKSNTTSIARHRRHIIHANTGPDLPPEKPASNIEILEAIIAKGYQNRKNWRPTISDTMKAMDQWFRLTQGNPFDELLDTLAAAGIAGNEMVESPAAVALADEIGEDGE